MIYTILFPDRIAEFEIQAHLFSKLIQQGINVRGEVKAEKSRLDLVIFNEDNQAICLIEVKSSQRIKKRKYKRVKKYENLFGLPVIVCTHQDQIRNTIDQVKEIINGASS